uniref:Uncharacterized protein n=1 Tax=Strigamia maritima TaxID=126957 RepID=T1IU11_STRMM
MIVSPTSALITGPSTPNQDCVLKVQNPILSPNNRCNRFESLLRNSESTKRTKPHSSLANMFDYFLIYHFDIDLSVICLTHSRKKFFTQ